MIFVPQVRLSAPGTTAGQTSAAEIVQPRQDDYGRQIQQLASTMGQVGVRMAGMGEKAIKQANVAVARKQVGLAREKLDKLLQGDGGYLYSLGEEALNRRQEAMQGVDLAMAGFDAEGTFDNDVQRQMFNEAIQADVLRTRIAINAHGEKQARVMDIATAKTEYEHQTKQIAQYGWSANAEAVLRLTIADHREASGDTKEVARARFETQLSAGLSTHISDLIEADDFDGAQAALDAAYDKEDKDGNKRDKLIGGARGDLTNKLQSAKEQFERVATAKAEREATEARRAKALTHALDVYGQNSNLLPEKRTAATTGALLEELIANKNLTPDDMEAGLYAINAVRNLNTNRIREQETRVADATSSVSQWAMQQELNGITYESGEAFTAALTEQVGEDAVNAMRSTNEGQELLLRLQLRNKSNLTEAERAKSRQMEAEARRDAERYLNPGLTTNDNIRQLFPNDKYGKAALRRAQAGMAVEQAKQLQNRFEEAHSLSGFDQAYASESVQIRTYLERQPWAALKDANGKVMETRDGQHQVDPRFHNVIAAEWAAYQQRQGQDLSKVEFSDWFNKTYRQMDEAKLAAHMFQLGGVGIPRQFLGVLTPEERSQTTRDVGQAQPFRVTDPEARGADNVLDLLAREVKGAPEDAPGSPYFPLPSSGKRKAPLDYDTRAEMEAIYMRLPPKMRNFDAVKNLIERKELFDVMYPPAPMSVTASKDYARQVGADFLNEAYDNGSLKRTPPEGVQRMINEQALVAAAQDVTASGGYSMPRNEAEAALLQEVWFDTVQRKMGEFQLAHRQLTNAPVTKRSAKVSEAYRDIGPLEDSPDYSRVLPDLWYVISGEWFWASAKK
ncbi:MAG: hypothetical protein ACO3O3_11145 [Ilumatobacteraceae bacterium]